VEEALGARVSSARRVSGGMISEAWALELDGGPRVFVKARADANPGEFPAEAAALRWLAEPGALRVPEVLACDEGFLALEWIEPGRLDAAGVEELGRGLAGLHTAGAPACGAFPGGPERLPIGPLQMPNAPADAWPEFYAECRLRPLIAPAVDRGSLSSAGARAVERVCERIDDLAGPPEPPARLHGDLWGGNVLAGADGRPWLIDPAAHGGHREVDLAMLRLFGAPPPRAFAAYEEVAPLAAGHEDRVGLWQLFPLLVHAVLFGGGYGGSAEETARRYGR
jgi:fructosamine-3-kinase